MVKKSLPKPPLYVAGCQNIVVVTQAKHRPPPRHRNMPGNMGQQLAPNRPVHLKGPLLPASCRIYPRITSELSFARLAASTYVSAVNSQHNVFNALTMAARLPPPATEEDIVCLNSVQNIFLLSTSQDTDALAYCTVQEIILTKQRHPVATYLTPPGHSCRKVIRGVDIDFRDADLQRMLRTPRNPTVLSARRINNTTMVVILFNGLKVPNYVYCGPIMYRCTLCKRQIDTCRNCGRVGHRQDVCPHHTDKVCDHQCGHGPTGPDHVCSAPKCALCEGAHLTGNRTCRSHYQVPYLVRCRRQRRRRRNKSHSSKVPAASFLPSTYT
ncbi:hypothetical protein HPB51_012383 [Rhipicephalus microplus]|uniref:CCHC-type domain-containing protein n=1 Tax=Rhipicephalus microplus TaxID=6941 RepID=A0A9J6DGG3_RHIMP|nr:hypothetical protein HPB51_012383 [Rhipicephalus microplus]